MPSLMTSQSKFFNAKVCVVLQNKLSQRSRKTKKKFIQRTLSLMQQNSMRRSIIELRKMSARGFWFWRPTMMRPLTGRGHWRIGLMFICLLGCSIRSQRPSRIACQNKAGIFLELLIPSFATSSEIEFSQTLVGLIWRKDVLSWLTDWSWTPTSWPNRTKMNSKKQEIHT